MHKFHINAVQLCEDTAYVEYFIKGIIELVKVNMFLILRVNLDSKI